MSQTIDGYVFAQSASGDAFCCQRCGGLMWTGQTHTCASFRQVTLSPGLQASCVHCYCRQATAGPAHRLCCNCGNRQALVT